MTFSSFGPVDRMVFQNNDFLCYNLYFASKSIFLKKGFIEISITKKFYGIEKVKNTLHYLFHDFNVYLHWADPQIYIFNT